MASQPLIGPALEHAREALARASAERSPARAAIASETALEWAEAARDLKRAREAEHASDRLEQEASALQTELARLRAAVEQAMARVGQLRQEVAELEKRSAPRPGPAPRSPRPMPPPSTPGGR